MIDKTWYDNCLVPLDMLTLAANALRDEGWSVISVGYAGIMARPRQSIALPSHQDQPIPVMVVMGSKMGSSDQPELMPTPRMQ